MHSIVWLYCIVIFGICQNSFQYQFNLRNIYQNQHRYCLLYYVHDHIYDDQKLIEDIAVNVVGTLIAAGTYVAEHQLISYCLRLAEKNDLFMNLNHTFDLFYTFEELREKNISSEQLIVWSQSIDLAENYEIFLNNLSNVSQLSEHETIFYNCTSPMFGPFCSFTFNISNQYTFEEIVDKIFSQQKWPIRSNKTCYTHLKCQTFAGCLDWRQICNRYIDCIDGSDELHCWQLELNQCSENEYRCSNGQCIPIEFFNDALLNSDCLDKTDERFSFVSGSCHRDPAFRCEESICRPREDIIPYGPGECSPEFSFQRQNGYDELFFADLCSRSLACFMNIDSDFLKNWCQNSQQVNNSLKNNCHLLHVFTGRPITLGHIRFLYNITEPLIVRPRTILLPNYICYDNDLCKDFLPSTINLNNLTCRHTYELLPINNVSYNYLTQLINDIKLKFRWSCISYSPDTPSNYCNHSTMYQCFLSRKCISKHRLVDGYHDCPFRDDELYSKSCSLSKTQQRIKCTINNLTQCYIPFTSWNSHSLCSGPEERLSIIDESSNNFLTFPYLCNAYVDILDLPISEYNNIDEIDCENWPCNNTYTRCNGVWDCDDGIDELNCPFSNCSHREHTCVLLNDTSKISCISMDYINNGIIDCLGGTDERMNVKDFYTDSMYRFTCRNQTSELSQSHLCNNRSQCINGDDEIFCTNTFNRGVCSLRGKINLTTLENYFCQFTDIFDMNKIFFFKLHDIITYPSFSAYIQPPIQKTIKAKSVVDMGYIFSRQCNRGISISIRMINNQLEFFCLCPPSYYGDQCQYQSERISLTIQIQVSSDWYNMFLFIITLINDENSIDSYDYIEYLHVRDCQIKFNIYLLYSTQPKNSSTNYRIRIDALDKSTFQYRTSWLFPIQFSFLPVYRLGILLKLPITRSLPIDECSLPCIHGQCFRYFNEPKSTFCRCSSGWSGVQCNIKYQCDCAPDSLCLHESICICPFGRYGRRCYLNQSSCRVNPCMNNGQCLPQDERYISLHHNKPICICPEGYSGDQCESRQGVQINVKFHEAFSIPQSLLIHLIGARRQAEHTRISLMKKIPFDQNSVSFYTSKPFHLAFADMSNNLYLIVQREETIILANIHTEVIPTYRCQSDSEIFNKTFLNLHLLKRMKFYHQTCIEKRELICFRDTIHICLCNRARQANCFRFDHNMSFFCQRKDICENAGQCFQNDVDCPTTLLCVCPDCYYGSRCQFSTKGSTLSLDTILAYAIRQHTKLTEQSNIVHVAMVLTMVLFTLGVISNLLSFLTFQSKKVSDVGCGVYLLVYSIVSTLSLVILVVKFWILLAAQIDSKKNRLLFHGQCLVMDYFLRFLVSTADWLSACVAIDRTMNVSRGVQFDKNKSQKLAKWIIGIVFLLTSSTYIHDPIFRQLIDDEDEQRTWCVTKYSSISKTYDHLINIFHFSIPVCINCISAILIIIYASRIRSNAQKNQTYKQILHEQFQQHKHLLISQLILFLLALPRLIFSFLFQCMKSSRNPWLYLIGYYLSFLPLVLTFIIFILPSKSYKQEFYQRFSSCFRRH